MPSNTPLEVVLRMIDLYNDGTPESYGSDRYIDMFTADAVIELMPSAQAPKGRIMSKAELREAQSAAEARLRNRRIDIHQALAEGEKVVVRYTFSASTAAEAPGVPPGSRMLMDGADFFVVRGGLISRYLQLVTVPRFESS